MLLWALMRASSSRALGKQVWMVPVNLRGPIKRASPEWMHSAFIDVPEQATYAATYAYIRTALTRFEPFARWFVISLLRFAGKRGTRFIVWLGDTLKTTPRRSGAFSNLGEHHMPAPDDVWYGAPPVSAVHPIGASAITTARSLRRRRSRSAASVAEEGRGAPRRSVHARPRDRCRPPLRGGRRSWRRSAPRTHPRRTSRAHAGRS